MGGRPRHPTTREPSEPYEGRQSRTHDILGAPPRPDPTSERSSRRTPLVPDRSNGYFTRLGTGRGDPARPVEAALVEFGFGWGAWASETVN